MTAVYLHTANPNAAQCTRQNHQSLPFILRYNLREILQRIQILPHCKWKSLKWCVIRCWYVRVESESVSCLISVDLVSGILNCWVVIYDTTKHKGFVSSEIKKALCFTMNIRPSIFKTQAYLVSQNFWIQWRGRDRVRGRNFHSAKVFTKHT